MKFTIRDLFWLILLASVLCMWYRDANRGYAVTSHSRLSAIVTDAILRATGYSQ